MTFRCKICDAERGSLILSTSGGPRASCNGCGTPVTQCEDQSRPKRRQPVNCSFCLSKKLKEVGERFVCMECSTSPLKGE